MPPYTFMNPVVGDSDVDEDEDDYGVDGSDSQDYQRRIVPADRVKAIHTKIEEFGIIRSLDDWVESFLVSGGSIPQDTDPNDDYKREDAFYECALSAVTQGESLLKKHKVKIARPGDYFAEMIKTDDHMEKVRQKMLNDEKKIEAQEKARKQRENKKYGKKVQQQVLQERAKAKRATLELAQRRGKGLLTNEMLDFDVEAISGQSMRRSVTAKSAKRQAKDARFGFGGKKRHSKSNTKASTDDMSSHPGRKMKIPFGASKGKKSNKRPGKNARRKNKLA